MAAWLRSFRFLAQNWKLAAISIFSLSVAMALAILGLGVSNTSLLVPPPGAAPDQLVDVYLHSPDDPIGHISYRDYQYYRQNNRVFSDVAATASSISLSWSITEGESARVTIADNPVSENYFSVLGIRPYLGRFFLPGEETAKTPVGVLTYFGWTRLGSDPNIVGKTIAGVTVIGVAPKDFTGSLFGLNGDMVVPLPAGDMSAHPNNRQLILLARLKPGVVRAQAQADMTLLSAHLAADYPKEDKDRTAILTRATILPPEAIPTAELLVAILMILVLLVLLIACANVANLLLALAVGRRQEATIKRALGASRLRIIGEFLRESVAICALGGALASLLVWVILRRYSVFNVDLPAVGSYSIGIKLHFGGVVLAGFLVLLALAVLATGLPAALYAGSPNLSQVLAGEVVVGGTRKMMRRNLLVSVQVAVCTLVLVGLGLCWRSLYNLRHVDPGFSSRNLLTEILDPQDEGRSRDSWQHIYENARQKVAALPGIQAVTLTTDLPLFGDDAAVAVQLPGSAAKLSAMSTIVDSDYFSTFGIPILAGRSFNATDTSPSIDSLIVNRTLAKTLRPDGDVLGRSVLTGDPLHNAVIVGVVADSKYDSLDEDPQPFMYYALSQHYQGQVNLTARTAGPPAQWAEPFARAIRDAGILSATHPVTFESWENISLLPQRLTVGCVAVLASMGMLLAIVGLFGAISCSVSERKKELGIRVALGAGPWQLLKMIFRQTLIVAGAGAAVGIALGIATSAILRSQFFGIGAVELSVLVPVAAAMLAISLLVAYLSARPWLKVDPMSAVRHM